MGSSFLKDIMKLRGGFHDWNNLPEAKDEAIYAYNPLFKGDDLPPVVKTYLRLNLENMIIGMASRLSIHEISGDQFAFNVMQAKGQRAGYSPYSHDSFVKLQSVSGVPDIGKAFSQKRLTPRELLDMRNSKEAALMRKWFSDLPADLTADEVVAQFVDTLDKGLLNSIGLKVLRFAVVSGIGILTPDNPVVGVGASAVDSFLLNKLFPVKSPRLFMESAKMKLAKLPSVFKEDP